MAKKNKVTLGVSFTGEEVELARQIEKHLNKQKREKGLGQRSPKSDILKSWIIAGYKRDIEPYSRDYQPEGVSSKEANLDRDIEQALGEIAESAKFNGSMVVTKMLKVDLMGKTRDDGSFDSEHHQVVTSVFGGFTFAWCFNYRTLRASGMLEALQKIYENMPVQDRKELTELIRTLEGKPELRGLIFMPEYPIPKNREDMERLASHLESLGTLPERTHIK